MIARSRWARGAAIALFVALCGATAYAKAKAKPAGKAAPKPVPAAAAQSFEDMLSDAEPVSNVSHLIDPLFDNCSTADALDHRQCEGARTFLETEARGKTYVAIGDIAALEVSPYDAVTKEVDLDVQGCIACLHPPQLVDSAGKLVARFITTKVPRAIKSGRAIGLDVASIQLSMSTPEREQRWKKQEKKVVPRLRVQWVFKLGPLWESGTFSGVTFVPLGYRIFDACSGEVFETSPPIAGGDKIDPSKRAKVQMPVSLQPGDPLRCPAPGEDLTAEEKAAKDEFARLPLRLSREAIEKGMVEVQERVHDCHVEFEESGTVNLRLVIEGPSGKVKEAQIYPPFEKTPAGLCVRAAAKAASFSHFKSDTQEIKIPVYLR